MNYFETINCRAFIYCTEKAELIESHTAVLKLSLSMAETVAQNVKTFVRRNSNTSGKIDTSEYKPSEYLPEGWLGKEKEVSKEDKEEGRRDTHIKIMNDEGVRFGSYKKASEFMKASEKYTPEDIEKLYLYPDGKRHIQLGLVEEWKTSEYLPQGWLCLAVKDGSHINIASSDTIREKFRSYKKAAEFLKANPKYTSDDVDRLYLYPDGTQHLSPETEADDWKPSKWLPKGWTCCPVKKNSDGKLSKWKKSQIKIKSPEGERFHSYSKTALFMRANTSKYTEEDIRKLQLYPDGKTREQRLEEASWSSSEYLPEGWKCKPNKFGLHILTSEGKMMRTYRMVVQYMKSEAKYSDEDSKKALLYPDGKKHELEVVRAMLTTKSVAPSSWRSPTMPINRAPGPRILPRPAIHGAGSRGVVPGPQTRPQNLAPNHPQYLHPGIQYTKVQVQPKTAPGPQIFPRKAPGPEEVPRVKRSYVKKIQKAPGPASLPPGMTISQNQVQKSSKNLGMKIMNNQAVRIDILSQIPILQYQNSNRFNVVQIIISKILNIDKSKIIDFPARRRDSDWSENCSL